MHPIETFRTFVDSQNGTVLFSARERKISIIVSKGEKAFAYSKRWNNGGRVSEWAMKMDGKFFDGRTRNTRRRWTACFKSVFLLDGETSACVLYTAFRESNGKFHESKGDSTYETKRPGKTDGNFDKHATIFYSKSLSSYLIVDSKINS